MTANTSPIFPLTPYAVSVSLAATTACSTRAPTITASLPGANIIAFVPVSTDGARIDRIEVKGCSTSFTAPTADQLVGIWLWDGTTAFLIDEILVSAITPSTTGFSFKGEKDYSNLVLPAAFGLYISTSITTTAATTALSATAFGGTY